MTDNDPTAAARKQDHIELAFRSQITSGELDERFHYEPLLAGHPPEGSLPETDFGGKTMRAPLWVSSMTGGTERARGINHRLAQACAEFGLGMGLGSCRSLLYSTDRLADFDVRPIIGDTVPLFANLGVAQVEELIDRSDLDRIPALIDLLRADGLIIHVNPLQEWLQPEGDRFQRPPLEIIKTIIAVYPELPLIVKEVGQGFGPASLHALLQLPLLAVEFAANGGTNFSKLELFRADDQLRDAYGPVTYLGHSADQMTSMVNSIFTQLGDKVKVKRLIVSGGVQNFLDGYFFTETLRIPAIYGQASAFLRYAQEEDYSALQRYVDLQVRGLEMAHAFLRVRR